MSQKYLADNDRQRNSEQSDGPVSQMLARQPPVRFLSNTKTIKRTRDYIFQKKKRMMNIMHAPLTSTRVGRLVASIRIDRPVAFICIGQLVVEEKDPSPRQPPDRLWSEYGDHERHMIRYFAKDDVQHHTCSTNLHPQRLSAWARKCSN